MNELNNNSNSSLNENNSFDLSILDKVKPPVVDYDEVSIVNNKPVVDESFSTGDVNPYEETVINTNPYVEYNDMNNVIGEEDNNSVLYDNVYNKEDNILIEEEETEPVQVEQPKDVVKNIDYSNKVDVDFKELEKVQEKQLRKEKIKSIRFVFIIFMLLVIATLFGTGYFNKKKDDKPIDLRNNDTNNVPDNPVINESFSDRVQREVSDIYNSKDTSKLQQLLEESSEDVDKNNQIHTGISSVINTWITGIKDERFESYDVYNSKITELKGIIDSIYNIKSVNYYSISDEEYSNINNNLNKMVEDGRAYYEALVSYNSKDYNNAYRLFDSINSENTFYDNSRAYLDTIIKDILALLQNDIDTMSINIDMLSEEEKQVKYQQIKGVIERYVMAYPYVGLSDNATYQELLNKYN